MQRLFFSLKFIPHSPRNLHSVSSQTILSLSKTTKPPPVIRPHFFATASNSFWRSHSHPNPLAGKLTGFVSNPLLAKQFLPKTLLNGQSKGLVNGGAGFIKAQFSRSYYGMRGQSNPLDRLRNQWRLLISRTSTPSGMLLGIIMTNVAVLVLWRLADWDFMRKHFTVSLDNIRNFSLHTMITSGFSHTDAVHLIFNMIGLYFFGSNIGRLFGAEALLGLYLKGAFVGSIFFLVQQKYLEISSKELDKRDAHDVIAWLGHLHSFLLSEQAVGDTIVPIRVVFSENSLQSWGINHSKVSALGASGAVNAVMLLDIFLFPTNIVLFEFFIPVPAILLGVFLIGKDLLRIERGDTEVSGAAHLGGAAVAAWTWLRIRRGRF